jgi:chemotaxis protein methyltransferase CheR
MAAIRNSAVAAVLATQQSVAPAREFAVSEADFQRLAKLAYEYAGVSLSESKQNLIYSRLSRRLRVLKLETFRDYCEYLDTTPSEVENFINSLSTNHTKFFREVHHFEHFRAHIAGPFGQAVARKPEGACGSGPPDVRAVRSPTRSLSCLNTKFAILARMT